MLLCISISSLPLSLLHHHEHQLTCEAGVDIPLKFKKDKDQYNKHFHSHEKECFLCFQSHLSSTKENIIYTKIVLNGIDVFFIEKEYQVKNISLIELKGRSPPSFSLV